MKDLIKKLVEAWGPSGYEHHVRALIRKEVEALADEITVDPLGNMICRVGNGDKKMMVAAHMDEIGVMAMFTEPKTGYLRFSNIGGLNLTTLMGNRVKFEDGTIGVIGAHDSWKASTSLNDYYIDVSTGDGDNPIQPGSPAGFWREMTQRGHRIVAKALDDRIGCVVAIETMRKLNKKTPNSVYFVFTVQEEVGLRGARVSGFGVDPDVAVALDVTRTGDEIKNAKMAVALGGGAAIKIQDPGLIVPPAVRDWMIQRAEADKIPHQLEVLAAGTTDAAAIQMARAGIPSGCISIPTRFIHTVSETVDERDVQACIDLLTGLASNPLPFG